MGKKHWVDDDHYREVSDDGRKSWLYEADGGLLSPDTCVEVAEHHEDGTTTAWEKDSSIFGELFWGGKGKKK